MPFIFLFQLLNEILDKCQCSFLVIVRWQQSLLSSINHISPSLYSVKISTLIQLMPFPSSSWLAIDRMLRAEEGVSFLISYFFSYSNPYLSWGWVNARLSSEADSFLLLVPLGDFLDTSCWDQDAYYKTTDLALLSLLLAVNSFLPILWAPQSSSLNWDHIDFHEILLGRISLKVNLRLAGRHHLDQRKYAHCLSVYEIGTHCQPRQPHIPSQFQLSTVESQTVPVSITWQKPYEFGRISWSLFTRLK